MTTLRCPACGTELSPVALACPACGVLTHADALKRFAADAEAAMKAGDLEAARSNWMQVLERLPSHSNQHVVVTTKIAELTRRIADAAPGVATSPASPESADLPWWRRGVGGIATLAIVLASKLKFLLLGLTKAQTFLSMFAFFATYWAIHGWPLALGLVLAIYIHEMGHVSMLRRLGVHAGAPLFIPGSARWSC